MQLAVAVVAVHLPADLVAGGDLVRCRRTQNGAGNRGPARRSLEDGQQLTHSEAELGIDEKDRQSRPPRPKPPDQR
jgi:hypothetical protein